MKKWVIKSNTVIRTTKELVALLLKNRNIEKEDEFFNPALHDITSKNLQIDDKQITKANKRIKKAIKNKELIIIYSDYDCDGICGAGILYEWLAGRGATVLPYVPDRETEGYGISKAGIDNILTKFKCQNSNDKSNSKFKIQNAKILIITIDNGVTANEAIDYANSKNINVIVVDHHQLPEKLPDAYAIVHTTKLCAGGLAWFIAEKPENSLDLVGIATIADMVPLTNENRIIAKLGLEKLNKTERPGLLAIFNEAGLKSGGIGAYEVGFIIAPRINAMGRMENALDSLRLLCTKKEERAAELAKKLGMVNRERQDLTMQTFITAKKIYSQKNQENKLIFLHHEEFNQGIIGLVAGKLTELYYKPAIIISKGKEISKASARSISGFNIIEAIRSCENILINAGGHPMAAGFTVATERIFLLEERLTQLANGQITEEQLQKELKIDMEIDFSLLSFNLYQEIQKFSPFGMGNPEPVFISRQVQVVSVSAVGAESKHLKLLLKQGNIAMQAIAFGMGKRITEVKPDSVIDIVYTIALDTWNGNQKLNLKIKDFKSL